MRAEPAIAEGLRLWQLGIHDPTIGDKSPAAERDRAEILACWGPDGLGWQKWVQTYPGNGSGKWCGGFVARCWRKAGLKLEHAYKSLASTWRLKEWGRENPGRLVPTSDISPGDIVCVGQGDYGSHVTLALAWDQKQTVLATIEGNAHGRLPSGEWAEGVVIGLRHRDEIRATYRPRAEDLE